MEKRLRGRSEDGDDDEELPDGKQIRGAVPSFAGVVREVVTAKTLEKILNNMEPTLREMVREGVKEGVQQSLLQVPRSNQWSPRIPIQPATPAAFELVFHVPPSLPIFSGTKIEGEDRNPLQLLVVSPSGAFLPASIKVEVVAVYGDFPPEGREEYYWTSDEFERSIVKERAGKRPLLAGASTTVTLRDGAATVEDIAFTDNSSWVKCRKFRIGARVAPGTNCQGLRIKEALTAAFVVKDHRGESYKKHHPPYLTDEVWRLEKISKDGKFHNRLSEAGINTVQDFLRLSALDSQKLKEILGKGMSDRMWETTIKHARECVVPDNERYLYRNSRYSLVLDPTCRPLEITIDGVSCSHQSLKMEFVEQMVREAWEHWDSLVLVGETPAATTTIALQGASSSAIVPVEPAVVMTNYYQNGVGHQNLNLIGYYSPAEKYTQIDSSVWELSHAGPPPPPAATQQGHAYETPNLLLPDGGSSSSQGFFVHRN